MTRQSIYGALDRLEGEGLVHSRHGESGQRLYIPGIGAQAMFETWMAGPVVKEPVRVELQAKIAMSRPKDAPLLLGALDAYERDCFEMLRSTNAAEVPMQSWRGLAMNLTRLAVDEGLQAELRWIAIARRTIEDFTSSPHQERS